MKTKGYLIMMLAVLFMIGTAGAFETGAYTFAKTIIFVLVSCVVALIGYGVTLYE